MFCLFILVGIMALPAHSQFHMIGTAQPMDGSCIQLTPDRQFAEGIAYSTTKLDLTEPFEIQFDIYLGRRNDGGADGITFVIHNDARQFEAYGSWGEGMGYGRMNPFGNGNNISPSIAVEFDTYQNLIQNDPVMDHIAYLENGYSFHKYYWHGGNDNFDLEDDRLHDFRFRWDPESNEITVFLDGLVVYQGVRDLINDIFSGQTEVIWGFTASTGRKHNLQYFCLRRIARR